MSHKIIKIILFLTFFLFLVFLYAFIIGFGEPKFYKAPLIFCHTRFSGIALPPIGIFICPSDFENENLRKHEMVHWNQYRRYGSIGFYARYVLAWISVGFSYDNNWMEIEAKNLS